MIETRFIDANGLSFETDIAGTGDRFVLMLHGFPESKYSWRKQIAYLEARGCTVWAPNLRGYGKSSRPIGADNYLLEHLVADVSGLMAAARSEGKFREFVLAGHDWGGAIAWAYAIAKLSPLDKLIILNMPHLALFRRGLNSPAQLMRSWYMFFFQMPWLPEAMLSAMGGAGIERAFRGMAANPANFTDEDIRAYRENALIPGALTAMINYYRANASPRALSQSPVNPGTPIQVPTLLLWGERDTALGKELTIGTERYVRDLTLRYLPDASHWVQQEASAHVNEMMGAFLEGRTVPEAADLSRR